MSEPQPTESREKPPPSTITISLCGDVMTGRGVDQILPHPSDPALHEPFVKDAREYVSLAERANGPIPRPVDSSYVWGDALREWNRLAPDVRLANLETSITKSNDCWPGKDIHYRMHPENAACLAAARFDCCSLANNHVLDWGQAGLVETIQTLNSAGLKFAGAGSDRSQAQAPAVLEIPGKGRVVIFSYGSSTSGIPLSWAAKEDRAGVSFLADLSDTEAEEIRQNVARVKRDNDIVVASIHWGPNWGYEIPKSHTRFAHRLIEQAGVDVIHGHSSHHALGIEVYHGRLILYGCGDFLDDYEGISGYEEFRDDLGLIYCAGIDQATGRLAHLQMTATQIRRMSVQLAGAEDVRWLRDVLNRASHEFGVRCELAAEDRLTLRWDQAR